MPLRHEEVRLERYRRCRRIWSGLCYYILWRNFNRDGQPNFGLLLLINCSVSIES